MAIPDKSVNSLFMTDNLKRKIKYFYLVLLSEGIKYSTLQPIIMTAAAKSVCYFGFYLYVTGLTLIFAPNLLLKTLQIPETKEVWIRIPGVLVFCIGYYYHRIGEENIRAAFKHTIPTRALLFISFSAFIALG
jgi:hypothetical protein